MGTREGARAPRCGRQGSPNSVHLALLPLTFLSGSAQTLEVSHTVISSERWVSNGSLADNRLGQEHNDQMREASARDLPSPRPPPAEAGEQGPRAGRREAPGRAAKAQMLTEHNKTRH